MVFLVGESPETWVCVVGGCRCYRGDGTGGGCSVPLPALPVLGGWGLVPGRPCCPFTPAVRPTQAKYKAREAAMKAQSEKKHGSDKEERGKLPESPKTAEEIWQQSVIGDYLARFKVRRRELEVGSSLPAAGIALHLLPCLHTRGNSLGLGAVGRVAGERVPRGGASDSTAAPQASWAHL